MNITFRQEEPRDYRIVENLTREAFWDLFRPGCDEHLLAHKMRLRPAFVPELDYVAEADGKIVGNILYMRSKVVGGDGTEHETLIFGPLSVLPEYQKQGVGGALMRHTFEVAKSLGYRAVIIFGHPEYYPRHGFVQAGKYGITTADGKNFDAFMARELDPGALAGVTGKYYFDEVYENLPQEEVDAFDRQFPQKEKRFQPKSAE